MKNSDFVNNEKRKIFIFDHFSEKNIKGEINTEKSLVDFTLPIPTLEDYLRQYKQGLTFDSRYEEYTDETEDFQVQDFRESDIEDIFDYEEKLKRKNNEVDIESKIENNINNKENEEVKENERREEKEYNRSN